MESGKRIVSLAVLAFLCGSGILFANATWIDIGGGTVAAKAANQVQLVSETIRMKLASTQYEHGPS
jgi:hypothetical protein